MIPIQNALLDGTPERPLLKICDFGYSKNEYLDSRPKSLSGTPDYIAPEVGATSEVNALAGRGARHNDADVPVGVLPLSLLRTRKGPQEPSNLGAPSHGECLGALPLASDVNWMVVSAAGESRMAARWRQFVLRRSNRQGTDYRLADVLKHAAKAGSPCVTEASASVIATRRTAA